MTKGKRAKRVKKSKQHQETPRHKLRFSAQTKQGTPPVARRGKYENIVANLVDAIVEIDSSGRFNYVSPQVFELAGFLPEEMIGKSYAEFIHPDDLKASIADMAEVIAKGQAVKRHHRVRHKDGHYIWTLASGRMIGPAEDRRVLIVLSDISRYKQAEIALKESEALYRGLFDNAPIAVSEDDYSGIKKYLDELGVDQMGDPEQYLEKHPEVMQRCMQLVKTSHLNQAALSIFGVKDKEDLMRNLLNLYSKESVDQFRKGVAAMIRGETRLEMETRLKNMSGEYRDVKVLWSVPPGFEKTYSKVLVSTIDITELKRIEEITLVQRDLANALSARVSLDEALRLCVQAAIKVAGMDCGGVYLMDRESGDLTLGYHTGLTEEFARERRFFPAGSVAKGRPFYMSHAELEAQLEESSSAEKLRVLAIVPVKYEGKVIACLNISSHTLDEVPLYARNAVEVVAGDIGSVIQRLMAEESLARSEEKYRTLFYSAPAAIVLIDLDMKILDANGFFRFPREQVVGRHFLDFVGNNPGERETAVEMHARMLKGEKVAPMEKYITIGKNEVWVEIHAALLEKDGKPYGVQLIMLDIAERKRAEKAMWESEEKYRALFLSAPMSIAILDLDLKVLETNGHFGIPREQILGKDWLAFWKVSAEDRAYVMGLRERLLKGEKVSSVKRRFPIQGKDFWVEIHAALIKHEGKPFGFQVIVMDITESKKLEEQLLQAQKMEAIGRLSGGVAHDFNNQLTVIMNVTEIIKNSLPADDPLQKQLDTIMHASERSASLTAQLLAFSRKQIIEPRVLNINDTLALSAKMLERLIGEDVKLNLELAPGPGLVRIDPGQLDQILINLVINACDAMPKGGKLTIETANVDLDEEYAKTHFGIQPGSYVMLAVSDTGTGIDKEVLPHIFEPFFTTKPVGKGTGLGLATVYGVVQQSGGEIFVYSESDQGSTFKIYLPRVESGTPSQPEAKSRSEILGGTETVLVVEDDKGVRGAIVAILKKRGYKIIEAPSGKEAIGLLTRQKEPIALMITDVVMPEMSGKQLADQVRTLRPEIKILFLSGYTENVIAHHGVLEPGINFLAKPFSIQSLTKKVREVLDQQNK